jgi:hypothetical protein
MKTNAVRIFDQFDSCAPRVKNESILEKTWRLTDHLTAFKPLKPDTGPTRPDGFKFFHFCCEVKIRETDVIDTGALSAALCRLRNKGHFDAVTIGSIVSIGNRLAIEMLRVPTD